MRIPYYQVDAFTPKIFGGNPAGVCPLERWLPDETLQLIAAENNLAETAFFTRQDDDSYHLRWFTPVLEVDLCGHATLASAFVLFAELGYPHRIIRFHTRSGWLTAEKKIAPRKISLYGASLGGGVAVDLASRKEHRALILVKTFTSLPDAAGHLYWWLPVPKKAMMTNRFDSLSKIGRCHSPVFIAHGTADTLIPHSQGEQLFEAANEPKRFAPMPGKDHNDELPTEE